MSTNILITLINYTNHKNVNSLQLMILLSDSDVLGTYTHHDAHMGLGDWKLYNDK